MGNEVSLALILENSALLFIRMNSPQVNQIVDFMTKKIHKRGTSSQKIVLVTRVRFCVGQESVPTG